MDGRKSFVFSWDKKHRKIHEEALLHFFNPSKKGQKFEPQPPEPKAPTKSVTQPPRASVPSRKKTEGMKTQQPPHTWDPLQCDSPFKERNTEVSYPRASYGQLPKGSPGKAARSSHDTADLSMTTSPPPSQRAVRLGWEANSKSFKVNEQKGEVSFFYKTNINW